MRVKLDEAAIIRVVRSLLSSIADASADRVQDDRHRIACVTAISTLFHVHEVGMDVRLLAESTLHGWSGVVRDALAAGTTGITVQAAGVGGAGLACTHSWHRLDADVRHWAALLGDRRRVRSFVPAHHLCGVIFAALLPSRLEIDVVDVTSGALHPTDLVVGAPPQIDGLGAAAMPDGIVLISTGASLRWELADALFEAGATVHDVYGTTETACVAVRTHPATWHRLLPFWRGGQGGYASSVVGEDGVATPLPDRVVWTGVDTLRLDGRKDAAVRIGGADVYPAMVAASIMQHPMVADCTVRLDTTLPHPRLKAAVVPRPGAPRDASRLVATLEAFCRERFTGAERPVRIDIVAAVPRSARATPMDWGRAA